MKYFVLNCYTNESIELNIVSVTTIILFVLNRDLISYLLRVVYAYVLCSCVVIIMF